MVLIRIQAAGISFDVGGQWHVPVSLKRAHQIWPGVIECQRYLPCVAFLYDPRFEPIGKDDDIIRLQLTRRPGKCEPRYRVHGIVQGDLDLGILSLAGQTAGQHLGVVNHERVPRLQ